MLEFDPWDDAAFVLWVASECKECNAVNVCGEWRCPACGRLYRAAADSASDAT